MAKWIDVCSVDDLQPDSGVCALVDGEQVAIFWMQEHGGASISATPTDPRAAKVYAVGNYDPFGNANVLSRGLIGDIGGQPVVASPLYKQHFNLQTGVCLEDETVKIPVYAIRIENGSVQVKLSSLPHGGVASVMKYNYYIADVFTKQIFSGAQIAVFPNAEGLSQQQMQLVARELNLSETVFVFHPDKQTTNRVMRIFSPLSEIDFAGHPIIATAFVLASCGDIQLNDCDYADGFRAKYRPGQRQYFR